jgi:predicted Zn finger-like uncharacterized protein
MPVQLTCPGCKSTLRVREDLAGKNVKCPRCANLIPVPAAEVEAKPGPAPKEAITEARADVPAKKPIPRVEDDYDDRATARSRRDEYDEEDDRRRRRRDDNDEEDDRRRRRDEYDEEDDRRRRRDDYDEEDRPRRRGRRGRDKDASEYVPCPQCGAEGATRVLWTFWGSFYGPAMFSHVRCPDCGATYNGRTGGSNIVPAVIFFTVPLVLICAIIGFVIFLIIRATAG